MAFDGNGTFVRLFNWVQDKTNGINITASRMDGEDSGFAAGLSLCLTRDNQGKPSADFLPATDGLLNIGSGAARWANFNGINITLSGNINATTGTASLSLINTPTFKATASAIQGLGPVSAAFQDLTPDTGTFTATYTGLTGNPTGTARWSRVGNLALLNLPMLLAASNSTSFIITGIPAAISPIHGQIGLITGLQDNGIAVTTNSTFLIGAGGTSLNLFKDGGGTGWTGAGSKGVAGLSVLGPTIAYFLN